MHGVTDHAHAHAEVMQKML